MKKQTANRLPVVAIIGRPNVGKSTLFNRIAGRRTAIVHDRPGVTRDRLYRRVEAEGATFLLVDTGGFDAATDSWDVTQVTSQARSALEEAAVVIFLVDGEAGLTPHDRDVSAVLRRSGKRVVLAVNKVDHPVREKFLADFGELGYFPLHTVSAEHGLGIDDLLLDVTSGFPRETPEEAPLPPGIAVVGRPNVGKSTLVNRLLGEERLITHDQPGTTRDAIDTLVTREGKEYLIVDTAGIRRRGKVQDLVEKVSVMRSEEAIRRARLCILLLDGREMVTDQDAKVAGMIQQAARGCIILVNKWDAVIGGDRSVAEKVVRESLPFMDWAPVLFVSAKTGFGLHKFFPLIDQVLETCVVELPTPVLTDFLYKAVNNYKPASYHGKSVTFGYMTQSRTSPPTFTILTNDPERVHFTYRRYLLNRFREAFDLVGAPIVFRYRRRSRDK